MLEELRVENLLIVDRAAVLLHPGLNVISGETGVGKSLILTAIGALFGGKITAEGDPQKETKVEGRFRLTPRDRARLADLDVVRDDEIVIRVTKRSGGAQRSYINGSMVSRDELVQIGARMVDVHGQKDMLRLLSEKEQIAAIDRFAGTKDLADRFREEWQAWRKLEEARAERDRLERDLADRRDLLIFQMRELEDLKPRVGEYDELSAKQKTLARSADIVKALAAADELLGDDDEGAIKRIGRAVKAIDRISDSSPKAAELRERLAGVESLLDDLLRDLSVFGESIAGAVEDPDVVLGRLDELSRAFKKYKTDEAGLAKRRGEMRAEMDEIADKTAALESIDESLAAAKKTLEKTGRELDRLRRAAARTLETRVKAELDDLRLAHATLVVDFPGAEKPSLDEKTSPYGLIRPRILWSGNPGRPPVALADAASGGEMSRLLLALKSILAGALDVPVMIFDEIETGIGPRLGDVIGRRLAKLAQEHQVICVTHLPQIAAPADRHLKIEKKTTGDVARLEIAEIDGAARIAEIAAMLGGGDPQLAKKQAKSLLEQARRGAASEAET